MGTEKYSNPQSFEELAEQSETPEESVKTSEEPVPTQEEKPQSEAAEKTE